MKNQKDLVVIEDGKNLVSMKREEALFQRRMKMCIEECIEEGRLAIESERWEISVLSISP